jgi:hypothetical protein
MTICALSFVACDAMFTNNAYASITHPTPSTDSIASMTASDILTYYDSAENRRQVASNSAIKDALLSRLAALYAPPAKGASAEQAAIAAARISTQAVPAAAQLSSSVVGYLVGMAANQTFKMPSSTKDIVNIIASVMPSDIASALASGSAMPASFDAMISAYMSANSAYTALGKDVAASSDGKTYAYTGLSSSEKNEIAADALLSGVIGAMTPSNKSESQSQAIWSALSNPSKADSHISLSTDLIASFTKGSSPITTLISASSLGKLGGF